MASAACEILAMAVVVAATSLARSTSSAATAARRRPCDASIAPPHPYPSLARRIHLAYQRRLIVIFYDRLRSPRQRRPSQRRHFKAYWSVPQYLFPPSSCQTHLPNLYSFLLVDCYFLVCFAAHLSPPTKLSLPSLHSASHLVTPLTPPLPTNIDCCVPPPKYATSKMRFSNSDEDTTSLSQNRRRFTPAPLSLSPPHR